MKVVIFDTPQLQARGLQYMDPIDPDTLFVFPLVHHQQAFHSRNVRHPFDLAFLSRDMTVLKKSTLCPEAQIDHAPERTYMAVESAAGSLSEWGFEPGNRVNF